MDASIFLLGVDERLIELQRVDYDSEDLFQALLANHPAMLQLAGGIEGKLLLIRREQPVPNQVAGSGRWFLDHLFLDREGVPVLVEVKQGSDTRARREVVAQMLDYAANGVAYWPVDRMVSAFRETAERAGENPEAFLDEFLDGGDAEAFWRQVEANLRSGRIRMLFVADRISKELARIVEFLNEQMRPAEVLAMEIEQFKSSDGMRTLVPRLLGATERAQTVKSVSAPAEQLSEEEWLDDLQSRFGEVARSAAERIVAWFRCQGLECTITRSQDAMGVLVRYGSKSVWPFFIRKSSGRLETSLQNLARTPAFREQTARQAIVQRMRSWPAPTLRVSEKLTGWPSIELQDIVNETLWTEFIRFASDVQKRLESSTLDQR